MAMCHHVLGDSTPQELDGKDCLPALSTGIGNHVQGGAGDELQRLLEGRQARRNYLTPPDAVEATE